MFSEAVKIEQRAEEGKGITTLRFPMGAKVRPGSS